MVAVLILLDSERRYSLTFLTSMYRLNVKQASSSVLLIHSAGITRNYYLH